MSRTRLIPGIIASKLRIYKTWGHMRDRCYSKKNVAYKYYGGRGISICPQWKNDFVAFYNWGMANGYKDHLTIDRINNDGNYEPSNCRWTTMQVQLTNKRNSFAKGEKHFKSRFSDKEIAKIRKLLLTKTNKYVCEKYGVTKGWVSLIRHGIRRPQ